MVEADNHLKLLSVSILDIYKVFEHIDMLSIGIWMHPHTITTTSIDPDIVGKRWSGDDAEAS